MKVKMAAVLKQKENELEQMLTLTSQSRRELIDAQSKRQ
jgi:hypothetical protein